MSVLSFFRPCADAQMCSVADRSAFCADNTETLTTHPGKFWSSAALGEGVVLSVDKTTVYSRTFFAPKTKRETTPIAAPLKTNETCTVHADCDKDLVCAQNGTDPSSHTCQGCTDDPNRFLARYGMICDDVISAVGCEAKLVHITPDAPRTKVKSLCPSSCKACHEALPETPDGAFEASCEGAESRDALDSCYEGTTLKGEICYSAFPPLPGSEQHIVQSVPGACETPIYGIISHINEREITVLQVEQHRLDKCADQSIPMALCNEGFEEKPTSGKPDLIPVPGPDKPTSGKPDLIPVPGPDRPTPSLPGVQPSEFHRDGEVLDLGIGLEIESSSGPTFGGGFAKSTRKANTRREVGTIEVVADSLSPGMLVRIIPHPASKGTVPTPQTAYAVEVLTPLNPTTLATPTTTTIEAIIEASLTTDDNAVLYVGSEAVVVNVTKNSFVMPSGMTTKEAAQGVGRRGAAIDVVAGDVPLYPVVMPARRVAFDIDVEEGTELDECWDMDDPSMHFCPSTDSCVAVPPPGTMITSTEPLCKETCVEDAPIREVGVISPVPRVCYLRRRLWASNGFDRESISLDSFDNTLTPFTLVTSSDKLIVDPSIVQFIDNHGWGIDLSKVVETLAVFKEQVDQGAFKNIQLVVKFEKSDSKYYVSKLKFLEPITSELPPVVIGGREPGSCPSSSPFFCADTTECLGPLYGTLLAARCVSRCESSTEFACGVSCSVPSQCKTGSQLWARNFAGQTITAATEDDSTVYTFASYAVTVNSTTKIEKQSDTIEDALKKGTPLELIFYIVEVEVPGRSLFTHYFATSMQVSHKLEPVVPTVTTQSMRAVCSRGGPDERYCPSPNSEDRCFVPTLPVTLSTSLPCADSCGKDFMCGTACAPLALCGDPAIPLWVSHNKNRRTEVSLEANSVGWRFGTDRGSFQTVGTPTVLYNGIVRDDAAILLSLLHYSLTNQMEVAHLLILDIAKYTPLPTNRLPLSRTAEGEAEDPTGAVSRIDILSTVTCVDDPLREFPSSCTVFRQDAKGCDERNDDGKFPRDYCFLSCGVCPKGVTVPNTEPVCAASDVDACLAELQGETECPQLTGFIWENLKTCYSVVDCTDITGRVEALCATAPTTIRGLCDAEVVRVDKLGDSTHRPACSSDGIEWVPKQENSRGAWCVTPEGGKNITGAEVPLHESDNLQCQMPPTELSACTPQSDGRLVLPIYPTYTPTCHSGAYLDAPMPVIRILSLQNLTAKLSKPLTENTRPYLTGIIETGMTYTSVSFPDGGADPNSFAVGFSAEYLAKKVPEEDGGDDGDGGGISTISRQAKGLSLSNNLPQARKYTRGWILNRVHVLAIEAMAVAQGIEEKVLADLRTKTSEALFGTLVSHSSVASVGAVEVGLRSRDVVVLRADFGPSIGEVRFMGNDAADTASDFSRTHTRVPPTPHPTLIRTNFTYEWLDRNALGGITWGVYEPTADGKCPIPDDNVYDPMKLGYFRECRSYGPAERRNVCRVGDFEGKHKLLNTNHQVVDLEDNTLPVSGWASIQGKLLVLGTSPPTCQIIGGSESSIAVQTSLIANFSGPLQEALPGPSVSGAIVLTQPAPASDTLISVSLKGDAKNVSYHISRRRLSAMEGGCAAYSAEEDIYGPLRRNYHGVRGGSVAACEGIHPMMGPYHTGCPEGDLTPRLQHLRNLPAFGTASHPYLDVAAAAPAGPGLRPPRLDGTFEIGWTVVVLASGVPIACAPLLTTEEYTAELEGQKIIKKDSDNNEIWYLIGGCAAGM